MGLEVKLKMGARLWNVGKLRGTMDFMHISKQYFLSVYFMPYLHHLFCTRFQYSDTKYFLNYCNKVCYLIQPTTPPTRCKLPVTRSCTMSDCIREGGVGWWVLW